MKKMFKTIGVVSLSAVVFASCVKTPEAGFIASKSTVAPGEEVQFSDDAESRKNVAYYYDMGDGTTYNERNPSHMYQKEGEYLVQQTLSATTNMEKRPGKTVSSSMTISVVGPTAGFTTPKSTYNKGEYIQFTNTTTFASENGYEPEYAWYAESGSMTRQYISGAEEPREQIDEPGEYKITLEVRQGQTVSKFSANITVAGQANTNEELQGKVAGKWTITTSSTHEGAGYTNTASPCWGAGVTPITENRYKSVTFNESGDADYSVRNDGFDQENTGGPGVYIRDGKYAELNSFFQYTTSNTGSWLSSPNWELYTYVMTETTITFTRVNKDETYGNDSCGYTDTYTVTLTR